MRRGPKKKWDAETVRILRQLNWRDLSGLNLEGIVSRASMSGWKKPPRYLIRMLNYELRIGILEKTLSALEEQHRDMASIMADVLNERNKRQDVLLDPDSPLRKYTEMYLSIEDRYAIEMIIEDHVQGN